MPQVRRTVKRGTKKNRTRHHGNDGRLGDSTSYSGPVILPLSNEGSQITTINMGYSSAIVASSGTVNTVFPTSLVTSCAGWTNMAAEWHEYRVLAMEVHLVPEIIYTGTQLYSPVVSVVDRATGGALTSYTQAADHSSAKFHSSRYDLRRVIKMDGPEESVWTATTTSFSWGWVKIWGTDFSSTQTVYRGHYIFLVQFRNHQ